MSKRTRQKQLARLAARRAAERRRRRRNRAIAVGVVVLLVLGAGGAVAWSMLGGEERAPKATESPTAGADEVACGAEAPKAAGEKKPTFKKPPQLDLKDGADYSAIIDTSCGPIEIDLLEQEAPVAVNNFVFLADEGFYDGLTFHRLEKGFVVQGGDPTGDGSGGPGYQFEDEVEKDATYPEGTVAMANSGPDTNGSQFFIVIGPGGRNLTPDYTIFGDVRKGKGVLARINDLPTAPNPDGQTHHPTEAIYIEKVRIHTS